MLTLNGLNVIAIALPEYKLPDAVEGSYATPLIFWTGMVKEYVPGSVENY